MQIAPEAKLRVVWVDYIRILAMSLVVLVHVVVPLVLSLHQSPGYYWWIGNVCDAAGRIATPSFLMIAGYLLLDKDEPLLTFYQKRVHKVVIPLIAWSLFYMFVSQYVIPDWQTLIKDIVRLAIQPAYYHLGFLYTMIGLYMYMPLLRIFIRNTKQTGMLTYYVALWFLAVAILPWFSKLAGVKNSIDLLAISGHAGYLVLGYILGKMQLSKARVWIAVIVGLLSLAFTIVGTYVLTVRNDGQFNGYLYERLGPNIILYAGSVFVIVRYLVSNVRFLSNPRVLRVVRTFSAASFGVYLIHAYILKALAEGHFGFTLGVLTWHPLITIPVLTVVTIAISFGATMVLKQIPVVKRIVP